MLNIIGASDVYILLGSKFACEHQEWMTYRFMIVYCADNCKVESGPVFPSTSFSVWIRAGPFFFPPRKCMVWIFLPPAIFIMTYKMAMRAIFFASLKPWGWCNPFFVSALGWSLCVNMSSLNTIIFQCNQRCWFSNSSLSTIIFFFYHDFPDFRDFCKSSRPMSGGKIGIYDFDPL